MNRQQRRAAGRKGNEPRLMGFKFGVTTDEAEILEEALALWLYQTRQDVEEPTPIQAWALERAEKLRQAFDAAVGNRMWRDVGARRKPPSMDDVQTLFDIHAQVECPDCVAAGKGTGTCCRSCGHGERDEHYDGTCETVIELAWIVKGAEREADTEDDRHGLAGSGRRGGR